MKATTLAQEVLILRSERGWTQQELANRIGTTQRTVAAWESGDSIPRKAMRVRIAKAFGLPENHFLGADGEEPQPEISSQTGADRLMEQLNAVLAQQEGLSEEKKSLVLHSVSELLKR